MIPVSESDEIARIGDHRVVPVGVLDDAALAPPLALALVTGGLPIAEITLRTPAALEATRLAAADCAHDAVSLGEVMLRFDPGEAT